MGNLTVFLQDEFKRHCPAGWQCQRESRFLPAGMERILGYAPRADVLLTRGDGKRRLWVEFEVSRADPVANHAKFATGHLFAPLPTTDSFVSMVSSHIEKGRRNLAANTIFLMRKVGIDAFQIPLLPAVPPARVKTLNHTPLASLSTVGLDVEAEVSRCLKLPQPVFCMNEHRILFASNALEVLLNVERWHHELGSEAGRRLWGRRRVQYFVFSPTSGLFAPAKFCAFTASDNTLTSAPEEPQTGVGGFMPLKLYATLDESEPRFDGNVAWRHLVNNIGYTRTLMADDADIAHRFENWLGSRTNYLNVKPKEAVALIPPAWA